MKQSTNIMIVGVGGQGTVLASRILGRVLLSQGYDVKLSEVHGMSQRGGSVVTYVKYGEKIYSPIVDQGEADYILAFEMLEAARWLPYLRIGGKLIANTQQIDPMPVVTGAAKYPEDLTQKLRDAGADLIAFDALSLALEAGNAKAVNVVLIGVLSTILPIEKSVWVEAIEALVPSKLLSLNLQAFELGIAAANQAAADSAAV